jgi:hypothetical protein
LSKKIIYPGKTAPKLLSDFPFQIADCEMGKPVRKKNLYAVDGEIVEFFCSYPIVDEKRFGYFLNNRKPKNGSKFESLENCLLTHSHIEELYNFSGYICVVALNTTNQKREIIFTREYVERINCDYCGKLVTNLKSHLAQAPDGTVTCL